MVGGKKVEKMPPLHEHLKSAKTDFLYFSQTICPYCVRAARTLEANGLSFTEVNLDNYDGLRQEVGRVTGHRTVPVVFDIRGDKPIFVGGSDHLLEYL